MTGLWSDLRYALRSAAKAPAFTAAVVVVLALGIGANTAIFSIVYGVLLKPLPFADSARLMALQALTRGAPDGIAYLDLKDWAAQSTTLDRIAGYATDAATLTGGGDAESLPVAVVTGNFFALLGVQPLRGRWLAEADDSRGAPRVMVIGERLWERRFHRDDRIVGQSVMLDDQPCTIVGVMAASFEFPYDSDRPQAWLPMHALGLTAQFADQRGAGYLKGAAHLNGRTTIEQANAELATIAARLGAQYPDSNKERSVRAMPLQQVLVHDYRAGLLVLLAAVGVVLLIACVNVANLLLARGTTRRREIAVRMALGAGRSRLVRQFLTEAVLLSIIGGVAGLILAFWTQAGLVAASPIEIPRLGATKIDGAVLAFVAVVSLATAIVFGLVPALQATGRRAPDSLKEEGRGSTGGAGARTRQVLVVGQIALSLVLLASAGLLVRSLMRLQRVDPGFVAEHAAATMVMLPASRYPDAAAYVGFYHRLLDALPGIPGARASAVATTLPLSGSDLGVGFSIAGQPEDPAHRQSARYYAVSPDYFTAMGIRVVRGRTFTDRDNETAPNVVIISEAMARRYWPGEDAIGKRLTVRYNRSGPREIIGIVSDVKQVDLAEPATGDLYTPYTQTPWPFLTAIVRTSGDPRPVASALRELTPKIDSALAVADVKLLTDYVSRATSTPRFTAALIGSFAALAALLAGFGLYGVMAYSVAQRQREIGIRLALGARAADVRSIVVGQAARLGAVGIGIGLAGALAATRGIGSLLFGISASDPLTFVAVCPLLAAVVLAAAYLPSRRAARVDPIVAMRAV